MWKTVTVLVYLFVAGSSLPLAPDIDSTTPKNEAIPTLATELLPPRENAEVANFDVDLIAENSSPSTELLPPVEGMLHGGTVFLINLYAIKNQSGENPNEILSDEFIKNTPALIEPVATVLLVLEEEDEEKPVSLDELAEDLEEEGFKVEKIVEGGDTKVIKVDFDGSIERPDVELIKDGKINALRKKRSPHGLLAKLLGKGGMGGGGCQGGCGGGSYGGGYPSGGGCQGGGCGGGAVGVIPIYVVPIQASGGHRPPPRYEHPQPQYHPPPQYIERPQYHPPPQYVEQPQYHPPQQPHYSQPQRQPSGGQCNVCGGNHGSRSHSSAQASAQSSSDSW